MAELQEWEARLEFERDKWRQEIALRREEQAIRKLEAGRSGWGSPVVVAIAAAALAAAGNAAVSYIDGRQLIALEDRKAEASRILEMIKGDDREAARNNLDFLLSAGLIGDAKLANNLHAFLRDAPDNAIPLQTFSSYAARLEDLQRQLEEAGTIQFIPTPIDSSAR